MRIITRKEAKEQNLVRYFTGKSCKFGHVSERHTKDGGCMECAKASARNYYYKNIDICRAKCLKYSRKNAEQLRANARKWYAENTERSKQKHIEWAKKNPERTKELSNKSRQKYIEEYRDKNRKWKSANPEKVNAINAKRRADKLHATTSWVDLNAIKKIYLNCPSGMQVDHIIPLKNPIVCGLHVPWNLQYLTTAENNWKNNKLFPEFME